MLSKSISRIWQWRAVLVAVPSVAGAIVLLGYTGIFQLLEWAAFDRFFLWRPDESMDERIVVVAIEEEDLAHIGEWPIPDGVLAELVEAINRYQPRAIGLDLYRDLPVEPGHDVWVEVMASTQNLIGVEKAVGEAVAPPPTLAQVDRVGLADLVLDADGKIRRGLLSHYDSQNQIKLGLGVKLSLMYLEAQGIHLESVDAQKQHLKLGRAEFVPLGAYDGSYVRANRAGYQILLNYRGQIDRFRWVSMREVLEGRVSPELMRDRLVLVGSTAQSLNDRYPTPYSSNLIRTPERMPGVIIHANLASHILSAALDGRASIRVLPESMEWLWISLWSGLGATGAWVVLRKPRFDAPYRFRASWTPLTVRLCLMAVAPMAIGYWAFLQGWWIPVVSPALAAISAAMALVRYDSHKTRTESQQRLNQFLEAMPVGVAVLDASGKPCYVNGRIEQLLGKGAFSNLFSEELSQAYNLYLSGTDRYYPAQQQPLVRALSGETSSVDNIDLRVGDRTVPLESWGAPIFDREGNIDYAIAAFRDITERQKAQQEHQQFLQELSGLNRELDEALNAELQLTDAAGRFVPHQFLNLLGYDSLVDVKLGHAVEQEMSILFADIRNFTTLSETMTPEDNFKFINAYLSRMEPAVIENNGFIDKYIGDGIMALFSGDLDADDAVNAGISMLQRLADYNTTRRRPDRPPLKIGIGINTGSMMLGTVGGKDRIDSTVISDTVNLAARIEGLTKIYRTSLLISSNTFFNLEDTARYCIRLIERVNVKGKLDKVSFFEVFDADSPEIRDRKQEIKTQFEQGILLYHLGKMTEARHIFQTCLEKIPNDPITQIYLARCSGVLQNRKC
ncbi:CHASE2 domain-containing protein [Oscillatoriales cyanobacterium LEGE 11467]|uniref:CHASE2 domain-containing protein n=1 Tax=Zarconia navalis LEGE 11467 TaxID=1828826 RepID=A0A928VUS4_9CYAN|nr:CHASE2 domain-containing protein [Zarconia navalis]MBE9040617.1 CHASE2 domain-containing protein [Zarconia navalis LEGE 11467]